MTTYHLPAPGVLIRERQVCEMIGVAGRTLRSWCSSGQFPRPIRLGNGGLRSPKRWRLDVVEAWIRSRTEKA